MVFVIATAAALCLISLGGGLYEVGLIDPVWPAHPEFIRPTEGGISRSRFWIPAHTAYEITLIAALILAWTAPKVWWWQVVAFVAHAIMRAWSGIRFIPLALRFERGDPALGRADAERWVRASKMRLPLDVVSGVAAMIALVAAARL